MKSVEFIIENINKNPIIDITQNFQNYLKLYAEVVSINPLNGIAYLKIVDEVLKPGAKPTEKIETSKRRPNKTFPLKVHYIKNAKIISQ